MKKSLKVMLVIFISFAFLFVALQGAEAAKKKKKKGMPKSLKYVGALKCDGSCHDPWYLAWMETGHGKSYDLLKPGERADAKKKAKLDPDKDYTNDPKCLRCHTTGYGQRGGFVPGKTEIDPEEPNLEQVGCEMCHSVRGGSQMRVVMKKTKGEFKRPMTERYGYRYDYVTGEACKRCHEHRNTPFKPSLDDKYKFNFEERKKKVHDYKKYINEDNKDQTELTDHGTGYTETNPLVIEDWEIKDGKIRFKKGTMPVTFKKGEGYTLHFQDGSSKAIKDMGPELKKK